MPAIAAPPASTCSVLEEVPEKAGDGKTQWLYCVEHRKGNTGMCAGMPALDGDFCLAIGHPSGALIPMAMTQHNLEMSVFPDLLQVGRLRPGSLTQMISLENETNKLRFLKNVPLPGAQLPATPKEQKARVKASASRAQAIPIPAKSDWLRGIPANVLQLIRTWLVGETKTKGVNNLLASARKARTPACDAYLNLAIKEFTKAGEPKISALAMIEESGCNPRAVSKEKALGLCQFMPDTANSYGLKAYPFKKDGTPDERDERLDPNKCIPAAAHYVKEHHQSLNAMKCSGTTIMKSLMAYNAGLPALLRRNICLASDDRTMAWRGEPGNYIRRILGMAYVLDGGLDGTEVPSANQPVRLAKRKSGPITAQKAAPKRRQVVVVGALQGPNNGVVSAD